MTPHRFLSFISENIYFPWSFLWLQFSSRTRKWWTFVSQEERSIACIYAILVFHFMPTLPNFVWTIPSTTCLWGTHYIAFLLCSSRIPSMPSNIYFFMFEKPVTFISLSWPAAVIPAIVCCRVENLFPFNRLAAQYLYTWVVCWTPDTLRSDRLRSDSISTDRLRPDRLSTDRLRNIGL